MFVYKAKKLSYNQNVTMLTKQKKGRKFMKKITLLLTLTAALTLASAVPAEARTVSASCLLNSLMSNTLQTIKCNTVQTTTCGNQTAVNDILKRCGIDLDKYNIQSSCQPKSTCPTSQPGATPAPAAEPTEKPAETPTPTAEPAEKPAATPAPTAKPTEKPTATPAPTAAPTTKPNTSSSESAMEEEVLRLVNEERTKRGLNALKRASDLDALARAHSADMINRHFFDHNNPDGQSPFDRMRAAGISYRAAAENIASGQRSAEAVMNAWMNSSGHRANILNATYTEIGIGAVKSSGGTIYWTQEFVKR